MTWEYRVIRSQAEGDVPVYAVHEVLWSEDIIAVDEEGNRQPLDCSLTVDPSFPQGETLEELKSDLEMYLLAFAKPVLDYETLKEIEP